MAKKAKATSGGTTTTPATLQAENLQPLIVELGSQLWEQIRRRQPSFFERRWWDDRILGAAMGDESLKVQMFRFVDVLPRLKTHEAVTQHLHEYFEEVQAHLPWAVQLVRFGIEHISPDSILSRTLAYNARSNAMRMAKRFIAGETSSEVLAALHQMRSAGQAFTLDLLGEAVISEQEADSYQQRYLQLIDDLALDVNSWPPDPHLDGDHEGPIPRLNLSIKLSSLVSQFRPVDQVGTSSRVKARLRPILRKAIEHHAHLQFDMEQFHYKGLTQQIFRDILLEDEFRAVQHVGIVLQAYLQNAEHDAQQLLDWVKERGTPVSIRLVKGAYWDYENIIAANHGWPVPVFPAKWQTDETFERLTRFLLENHHWLRPAFGSHNLRSLSNAIVTARQLGVPQSAYEIQVLYGMATEMAQAFVQLGQRLRVYTPFGDLIPGMAYLVRRLLENTSNESFLRQSQLTDHPIEDLLMPPSEMLKRTPPASPKAKPSFVNEPLTDFSIAANREAMASAIEEARSQFGLDYRAVINGRREESRAWITSKNPSRKEEIVGRVTACTTAMAEEAIAAAKRGFRQWSKVTANYRAEYLELVAKELSARRFEFAAWQTLECGKPWIEADADVAEAIDFCRFYAAQMLSLDNPETLAVPGEDNSYTYRPRGVAVVIAPWNFPLAILTGMTMAAVVAGNTVIVKPAEQSSVVAAKLMEIIQSTGFPDGVINFLPGIGEDLGPTLTSHPDVDLVAFTGSRAVGLAINKQAADPHPLQKSVKHVLAEMGGKNAIIIDADADLDEAVQGVISSAFGYAGQKCSACSRVIVLAETYDDFLSRLVEATKSLIVGPADDPATQIGPVIDFEAAKRIRKTIEAAQESANLVYAPELGPTAKQGYYVGPHIFNQVLAESPLATQEIFGPVLAVMKATDLAQALELANSTDYALTGGIYSRSPANIKRVRQEFLVGNLYINRPITGALVGRQPFGGFKLSGMGTKAGGHDYLKEFLVPVTITENTMRRGFAPTTNKTEKTKTPPTTDAQG